MRCDDIQERFIDFIYDDETDSPVNADIREHLRTCSTCRGELEELKQTRKYLRLWKDESPPSNIAISRKDPVPSRIISWRYLRYGAVAALVLISFMALANMQIRWNKDGFSFSAHLFAQENTPRNYYTKTELRGLLKQALDDTELRIGETNYLMMQKMWETIEQDRWTYASQKHNSN
jgi:hypothetical protein